MTRFSRYHRFQLRVAIAATLTALAMLVALGDPWPAVSGFSLLGLLGLGPALYPRQGIDDERDLEHHRSAFQAASAVTWCWFVLVATVLSLRYMESGVPAFTLVWMVLVAVVLHTAVSALVALRLDARGA